MAKKNRRFKSNADYNAAREAEASLLQKSKNTNRYGDDYEVMQGNVDTLSDYGMGEYGHSLQQQATPEGFRKSYQGEADEPIVKVSPPIAPLDRGGNPARRARGVMGEE